MKKVYFPNLNGLRFIAAFLVIIHHIEQIKDLFGFDNHWSNPFVSAVGKLGVVLFFVLSGFLITYLLLEEEKQTKTIAIKDFYLRRILRIWPLYYLVVILSFLVFPYLSYLSLGEWSASALENLPLKLTLFFFFLPNLALVLFPPVPYASQSWSVGAEEQFYLIWPLVMKWFKKKELLLYTVILGYLGIKFGLVFFNRFWANDTLQVVSKLWGTFSIQCMAIGGLFALYLYRKDILLRHLYNKYLQWAVIIFLVVLIGFGVKVPYLHYEFYSVLFGILILNLASNPASVVSLENSLLNYLGKISYGLYMFHVLGIVIALKGLNALGWDNMILQYGLSVFFTVVIAGASYKYFEKYFILKKAKFSKIISGENAMPNSNPAIEPVNDSKKETLYA